MPKTRPQSSPPPQRIANAIDALRAVWRGGEATTRELTRALDEIEHAKPGAPYALANTLTQNQTALRTLPRNVDASRSEIEQIADRLKLAQGELVALTQPTTEKGRLTSALVTRPPSRSGTKTPKIEPISPGDYITRLPGIGDKNQKPFNEGLHLYTVQDLLQFLPRKHLDYSKSTNLSDPLQLRGDIVVKGVLSGMQVIRAGTPRVQARLTNETGSIRLTWFSTYIQNQLHDGDHIVVAGSISPGQGGLQLSNPEWEFVNAHGVFQTDALVPVYPLTKGISQKVMRKHTRYALDATRERLVDWLADASAFIDDDVWNYLPEISTMYEHIHYPTSFADFDVARKRLVFERLFLLQLGMVQTRAKVKAEPGRAFDVGPEDLEQFVATLPFSLTGAQRRVVSELVGDLTTASPMTRLVQGDVGSGKTVVAAIGAWAAWRNHLQTAIMAPTELLAEQHLATFEKLFAALPDDDRPCVALLSGSTKAKARREILARLADGEIDVLIGTHALFSDDVAFHDLGFVVIDEQHRFGVNQRTALTRKAGEIQPHLLSMTATPIPRTLNFVLNRELDVSIIDERPPGRIPISTFSYVGPERTKAYQLVRHEVGKGHQVFVICPLVNESDTIVAKAAVAEAERLQRDVFPDLKVEVLHGKMGARQKEDIMERFRAHAFDILVSTSVIEVGIDIPNASVIMIEGADRFGLAQLHQFRGRVGRGGTKSYCLLLSDDASADNNARLQTMVATDDGFVLAEKDLELRGPGDLIGTRQSGLPDLAVLEQGFDTRILERARATAERLIAADPTIAESRFPRLHRELLSYWHHRELTIAPAS